MFEVGNDALFLGYLSYQHQYEKNHNVDGLSVSIGLLNDRVQGLARLYLIWICYISHDL